MFGAIIGDIVGSRFEWNNVKSKDFELFNNSCRFTDDSAMTLAIANALLKSKEDYSDLGVQAIKNMQYFGTKLYPRRGYGGGFLTWLLSKKPMPYNSWGNGAAMRVSPCGFIGKSIEEVKFLSKTVTEVSHNHPEGIKGAEATAIAIYLARTGSTIGEIKDYISKNYYNIDFTLDEIRPTYRFDVSCQGSVPQALEAFFESNSFEDAIRNAISIGGDSDTIGAITGGVAEAYYGIPDDLKEQTMGYLDRTFKKVINLFYIKTIK